MDDGRGWFRTSDLACGAAVLRNPETAQTRGMRRYLPQLHCRCPLLCRALTRVLRVGSAPMLQADIVVTAALLLVLVLVVVPVTYWIVRGIVKGVSRR